MAVIVPGANKKSIKYGLITTLFTAVFFVIFTQQNEATEGQLSQYYNQKISNKMVRFSAVVKKILPDDLKGSRHQKMIVKQKNITVLLAHNIDLSGRIPVSEGDNIKIFGEYEWNAKGGVVHWTHKDPKGIHQAGWVEHQGVIYQ